MKKTHTSLDLSKKLKEVGCDLESENYIVDIMFPSNDEKEYKIFGKRELEELPKELPNFFTYDILNDICIKYAKEFFGEDELKLNIQENIFWYIAKNRKQEAEDYIWNYCKFNPKNK